MKFINVDGPASLSMALSSVNNNEKFIVCGAEEEREYLNEQIETASFKVAEIANKALSIDVEAWFEQRKVALLDECHDIRLLEGTYQNELPNKQGFTLNLDIATGEQLKEVIGTRLIISEPWQIPACFNYGGWNDCPPAEVHCAIWKYWEEKYGAKIIGVSHDVIEAVVEKPPTNQQEAMQLAWQQYLYCFDLVEQGVENVANLASAIINHQYWFFWWD